MSTPWTILKGKYDYTTEVDTDTLPTGRTYHTPDGSYPSITTILGKTSDNTWLQKWIERVGEEEARRVSKEATDRGTLVHEYAEKHFNGEDVWQELSQERLDVRQMSRDLLELLSAVLKKSGDKNKYFGQINILMLVAVIW